MTKERLCLCLAWFLIVTTTLSATTYDLTVIRGPIAASTWVPKVLNDSASIAGVAIVQEEDGRQSYPIWWESSKKPRLLFPETNMHGTAVALSNNNQVLCRLGSYFHPSWELWTPEGGWEHFKLPNGYEGAVNGLSREGCLYGTFAPSGVKLASGSFLQEEGGMLELFELRKALHKEGWYGLIDSVIARNHSLLVNFTHTCCLEEDFVVWDKEGKKLLSPSKASGPRIILQYNNAGAACGLDYLVELDSQTRHFYWSPEEGFVYLQADLEPGTPDKPDLTVYEMNDAGVIVGSMKESWGDEGLAFIWSKDRGVVNLNDLLAPEYRADYVLERAVSINGNGEILAQGFARKKEARVYCVLHPLEE